MNFSNKVFVTVIVIHMNVNVRQSTVVSVQMMPQKIRIPQSNKYNVMEETLTSGFIGDD